MMMMMMLSVLKGVMKSIEKNFLHFFTLEKNKNKILDDGDDDAAAVTSSLLISLITDQYTLLLYFSSHKFVSFGGQRMRRRSPGRTTLLLQKP